jgi:hypothetical protein
MGVKLNDGGIVDKGVEAASTSSWRDDSSVTSTCRARYLTTYGSTLDHSFSKEKMRPWLTSQMATFAPAMGRFACS